MYNTYFTINTITEFLCFSIAFFCLFNERNPYWKVFIAYMFITFGVETTGLLLRNNGLPNWPLYAGYMVVECLMVSSFFYYLFKKYNHKASLLYGWLILFFIVFFTEMALSNFKGYPYKTASFSAIAFVIASLYSYLLILRDDNFKELSTYPAFWIINGMLFFYFGSTACNIFFEYLHSHSSTHTNLSPTYIIFAILNVILYGCWSYAFICRFRQR